MQGAWAQTPDVIEVRSSYTVTLTVQRLKDAIRQRHLQIAAEINQIAGLALPLKMQVWQDVQGQVRLAYNDPAAFARQHGIDPQSGPIQTMTKALHSITAQAAES